MLIYLVVSLAFSAVFLCGNVAQKIMYNVVMMVAIVCAAMLGAGIVGVIKRNRFLKSRTIWRIKQVYFTCTYAGDFMHIFLYDN